MNKNVKIMPSRPAVSPAAVPGQKLDPVSEAYSA